MKIKKILILGLFALIAMIPAKNISVFAAENEGVEETITEKNISLGTSSIKGAMESNIYYGTYEQTRKNEYRTFNIDPIKWRVLSNESDKLFLFSDKNLDTFYYHNQSRVSKTWENCTIRSWLNGYGASSNKSKIDYSTDNFINKAFSSKEISAILTTELVNEDNPVQSCEGGNNTEDKVFLLSANDVINTTYGFTSDNSTDEKRVGLNTYYNSTGGKMGSQKLWPSNENEADEWWLRDVGYFVNYALFVAKNGSFLYSGYGADDKMSVRPGFNLNQESILFTSAAKGGKSFDNLVENTNIDTLSDNDGYKLTIKDESRSEFLVEVLKTENKKYISYSNAVVGENEYITAMIVNEKEEVTYYGVIKNLANETETTGTIEINSDLLNKIGENDKLYILNEQYNGDYKTDYSSELKEVIIPADEENTNAYSVNFDSNANYATGTMDSVAVKIDGSYKLPKCEFLNGGYTFKGWSYTATGKIINTESIDVNENTTLYAIWISNTELIEELEKAIENLQTEIDKKADTETILAKIQELQNAITALDNVKNDYISADETLKIELENKIENAKEEAISAATTLVNNTKYELEEKINKKADAETINAKIQELQDAIKTLDNVKNNYATADETLKAELENKIANAQATLQAVINSLSYQLEDVKSELQTLITISSIAFSILFIGCSAFIIWFFIDRKKKMKI